MSVNRFDNTRAFVCKVVFTNCRLDAYKSYIQYALRNGYKVCSMEEFWEHRNSKNKFFVLRHDVDMVSKGTSRMFNLERQMEGVTSTYYFRKTTIDAALMHEMENAGFEVGFHYETLSNYVKEKRLKKITSSDIDVCRNILKCEIKDFNCFLNKKIRSICSHGAPENLQIGYSNNILLEEQDYADFDIRFEAYDKSLYEHCIDVHIMDNTICYNYGFSYNTNPMEAITEGKKHIIFLTHPNHWYQTFLRSLKDIGKITLGKAVYSTNREFERIRTNNL